MSVDVAWDRVEAWLTAHARSVRRSLRSGAEPPAVRRLAAALGVALPPDFTASVARHDGQRDEGESGLFPHTGDPFGAEPAWRLLPLDEVTATWEQLRALADAGEFVGQVPAPAPGVRADWWCPGWVPFADNGGGDALCLDTSPADGGRVGQVVLFWHDARERPILAGSFEELLTRLADGLESGRYVFDPDAGLVAKGSPGQRTTDNTLHLVVLLPMDRPTTDQLRVVNELSRHRHANLLEIRGLIRAGGFSGFGELVGDSLARVVTPLERAGIPYRLEPLPPVR